MKIRSAHRVTYFGIVLCYVLTFVAGLMALVMSTAKDRESYLVLFANPFGNSRIEPGFQYYMDALAHLGLPPSAGIVITCVLIYAILAYVWHTLVRIYWLESLLLFNFFVFSVFNYYLGTSIRMGLAIALALYATNAIAEGKNRYLLLLGAATLIHYGTIPFALTVTWLTISKHVPWRLHKIFIIVAVLTSAIFMNLILEKIGLGSYYLRYFEGDVSESDRLIPFKDLFFIFTTVLMVVRGDDSFLRRASLYGLPIFLYGVASGLGVFTKMVAPNIFLSAMIVSATYWNSVRLNIHGNLRFVLLFLLNIIALTYALNAYRYI